MPFDQLKFEEGKRHLEEKYNISLKHVHTGKRAHEIGMRLHIPKDLPENIKKAIDALFDEVMANSQNSEK